MGCVCTVLVAVVSGSAAVDEVVAASEAGGLDEVLAEAAEALVLRLVVPAAPVCRLLPGVRVLADEVSCVAAEVSAVADGVSEAEEAVVPV